MPSYRVFIAAEVITFLRTCRRSEQSLLTQFMDSLATNPNRPGDFAEQDDIGRPIQAVVVGRYAVFFWADHAVKEVKIVDLKAAD